MISEARCLHGSALLATSLMFVHEYDFRGASGLTVGGLRFGVRAFECTFSLKENTLIISRGLVLLGHFCPQMERWNPLVQSGAYKSFGARQLLSLAVR